jgi:chromosome segregation ATPase
MKVYFEKLEQTKAKISEENEMINDYESQIEELREIISDYENEYDYESDPNGNYYDLNYISEKNEEISVLENLIMRCESEIQLYESELEKVIHLISNKLSNTDIKLISIDDIRNHFGYISSSNLLKLWIMKFSINELVNDLKWIYKDDNKMLNHISNIIKIK